MVFLSARAMEKIPEEALPWAMGVSATLQVRPESEEWKTRAAGPPVPKKMSAPESARQVLLAANAPSLSSAAGMLMLESGFQSRPSDRKSTRLNSSHLVISYAVFCLKKKNR